MKFAVAALLASTTSAITLRQMAQGAAGCTSAQITAGTHHNDSNGNCVEGAQAGCTAAQLKAKTHKNDSNGDCVEAAQAACTAAQISAGTHHNDSNGDCQAN